MNILAPTSTHQGNRAITPFDVSDPDLYSSDSWRAPYARLRAEMPVSYLPDSPYGPYWSVVTHKLIQEVEMNTEVFSSSWELGGITIIDNSPKTARPNFIAMDGPRHTEQRLVVQPVFNRSHMSNREIQVRERTKALLDTLPVGQTFDWVEQVAIPLTMGMLCILLDFPWDERHDLKRWSDWATDINPRRDAAHQQQYLREVERMLARFDRLFEAKRAEPPSEDLISRMVHSAAMGNLSPMERSANLALLIVGGNDTTRNSMSGFVEACHLFPDQLNRLRAEPDLIPNAVQETIRWQSPAMHQRRTCVADTVLGDQLISAGDKVVMWYVSANRDESIFLNADHFDVARDNVRRHLAFGHGVHRCIGARLAEIQLATLIGEIVARGIRITPVAPPTRLSSPLLRAVTSMPVQIT